MRLDILGIANTGIFVTQPDTMRDHAIALRPIGLGKAVRLCRHLGKTHSRLDEVDIRHHMVMGDAVQRPLLVGRRRVADNPAS